MSERNVGHPGGLGEDEGVAVVFDDKVYSLSAIKKASYKYTDRFHVHISTLRENETRVVLQPRGNVAGIERLVGEFCNEVLDQDLRETVAAETEALRNLLLAHAFSRTALVEPQFETADYRDDPAGIAASAARSETLDGAQLRPPHG